MSNKDFLRAMTPFCHTPFFEGTEKYLEKNNPEILQIIDADGDGSISFTEFFFFLVLLQLELPRLRRAMKKFPNGKLSKEQCSQLLREIRKNTQAGKRQANKSAVDARTVASSEEDFRETNLALCSKIFKDKETVTFEDFLELQKKFKRELWKFHF